MTLHLGGWLLGREVRGFASGFRAGWRLSRAFGLREAMAMFLELAAERLRAGGA